MARRKWLILPALLLIIQVFRPERGNPQTAEELTLTDASPPPAPVDRVLKSACFNCHSNQTVWPWYSGVAPFSWFIADDVKRGRQDLNFSEWTRYGVGKRAHLLEELQEIVAEGDMPPWSYRLLHSEARLSQTEIDSLKKWANQERQKLLEKQESGGARESQSRNGGLAAR